MQLILSIVFLLAFVGWILNIVKLLNMFGDLPVLVLRTIGIFFPPLGAVLGYL